MIVKPCKICGHQPLVTQHPPSKEWFIGCTNPDCRLNPVMVDDDVTSRNKAIFKWNEEWGIE